jgi:predicted esterase
LNWLPLNANDYLEQLRTKRILLIHGKNDISINSSRSSKFYNELKEIGWNIIFNETEDDHSSVKSTTFSKITSWI